MIGLSAERYCSTSSELNEVLWSTGKRQHFRNLRHLPISPFHFQQLAGTTVVGTQ